MESMILKAIDLGLTKICFTEHQDYGYPENKENFDFLVDLPSYKSELLSLKDKYNDRIKILFGAEIGLMPTTYDKCRDFAALMILISSSVLLILLTKWIHMNLYILKHILEKKVF